MSDWCPPTHFYTHFTQFDLLKDKLKAATKSRTGILLIYFPQTVKYPFIIYIIAIIIFCTDLSWGMFDYYLWNPWNLTKTSPFKYTEHFTTNKMKIFGSKFRFFFHISAQNIDCGYSLEPPQRGGSNEYSHSMFLRRNKKNNVYPCKPHVYYIKVGFKGVKII